MLALQITEIKTFMTRLLRTDVFDHFLLQEAVITKDASFRIDGHLNKDFYTTEELEESGLAGCSALPFSMLRERCFDLIKGTRSPCAFKFVFLLSPSNLEKTLISCHSPFSPSDIRGLYFNLNYQDGRLLLTTGVSYTSFSPDKSLEHEWDRLMKRFLVQKEISFDEG